jgi:beta-N-acetylhexosaminidase
MLISGFEGTRLNGDVEELIRKYHVGGLILFERNFEDPEQLSRLIWDLQALAHSAPLFISVDQEGGRVSRLAAPFTRFPDPCCLGKARSESLAQRFGFALGSEMRSVGINVDYAPVLDVNTNPDNPIIGNRAFSNDPEWAARLAVAFMRGFEEAGILAVGKHFPGHGDTTLDSHFDLPVVPRDRATLEQTELIPFAEAIRNGLQMIMTAHVVYPAWDEKNPATFSASILQGILRGQLGFKGLIVSDDLEMKAVQDHVPFESFVPLGIGAGVDLFMVCHDPGKILALQEQMIRSVEEGTIPESRIAESVGRILDVKSRIPLAPADGPDLMTLARSHQSLVEEMQSYLE